MNYVECSNALQASSIPLSSITHNQWLLLDILINSNATFSRLLWREWSLARGVGRPIDQRTSGGDIAGCY